MQFGHRTKLLQEKTNGPRRLCRLSKRRRYERNRNGEGSRPGRYGFTVRHLRCDRCQRDYLPQHMHRFGRRWYWECGNCLIDHGRGWPIEEPARGRLHDARMRWRYQNDPAMLKALGVQTIEHLDFCGASSCDTYIPGFPPCVCTLPVGHDGMHHQDGVACSWMEGPA